MELPAGRGRGKVRLSYFQMQSPGKRPAQREQIYGKVSGKVPESGVLKILNKQIN